MAQANADPVRIVLRDGLGLPRISRSARSPIHLDPVEAQLIKGAWTLPHEGDAVSLPGASPARWTAIHADEGGVFRGPLFEGGYAAFSLNSDQDQSAILEASGHSMVYVNGEPRVGDVYQTGWTRLPVFLHRGANTLLFQCGRGQLQAALVRTSGFAMLQQDDITVPDRIVGEPADYPGGVIVVNTSARRLERMTLRVVGDGLEMRPAPVPPLPPFSTRKVMFRIRGDRTVDTGEASVGLLLCDQRGKQVDRVTFTLRSRAPGQTHKRTFVSKIDGSVQYYAVVPAQGAAGAARPAKANRALFLSLHGASVQALGQAEAYSAKSWGDIVCPTNRRPYGFDWENWGRLDAMEVLDNATALLRPDPARIYLTGHSMGGHGTWHLGATFPDRFAAIAPSAGWISLYSYAGAPRLENPEGMEAILQRAMLPSDTLALKRNYSALGVYILHGDADDNVPVTEARTMRTELAMFHNDFTLFEQPGAGHWWDASDEPGADCVDWRPMFDFFARHARPSDDSVRHVEFATADPGVSSRCYWAAIEQQEHALELSTIDLVCDPGLRRVTGATRNVALLRLDLAKKLTSGSVTLRLDGQTLTDVLPRARNAGQASTIWLWREAGMWRLGDAPGFDVKRPERCGPFKQAFRNRVVLVYGTHGRSEENSWSYARARYDAEQFWYRGNGSVDLISDVEFVAGNYAERNVMLYGNADTNGAWRSLLRTSPIQVDRIGIRVGDHNYTGDDLAVLFVRPRPGSANASVGVVAGVGLTGMRLTERLPYFVSGVEYPDWVVIGSSMLEQGYEGIRAAGYFGADWRVETGDAVFRRN